jgi:hypothetical protein
LETLEGAAVLFRKTLSYQHYTPVLRSGIKFLFARISMGFAGDKFVRGRARRPDTGPSSGRHDAFPNLQDNAPWR